ncbi:trehalase family glycosidase [Fangia hongkongensis]|uniref:trehalase family glycosidase n=1 Tax=Fangia hongkongensis TaxID=270495 RepID=UPI000372CB8A|nr:trehalase family glycosidase [Fangia hongkongensis]MBK2126327.1 alpha,alpha-trehalase [Fangia hongkongensis]
MIQIKGDFFECVQTLGIFPDSKSFVDSIALKSEDEILSLFSSIDKTSPKAVSHFFNTHFHTYETHFPTHSTNDTKPKDLKAYIHQTWKTLLRSDSTLPKYPQSKIFLPEPYIVPGGRFREIYYWDSYFTALGLACEHNYPLIKSLVHNFIFLQKTLGIIPNGARSYYTTRSQPPILVLLVDLIYQQYGIDEIAPYLPALEQEYQFWITKRTYKLNEQNYFHYCDPERTPRPESYIEDINLANTLSTDEKPKLYQAIRSAAESGWDFSSRWMDETNAFNTLCTHEILPIDLNAILYLLTDKLASYYKALQDTNKATIYHQYATEHKHNYQLFWHKQHQCFYDYNVKQNAHSHKITAAIGWPLFAKIATKEQALAIANIIESQLLKSGGLVTSTINSNQQWDAPNGWAPLQYIAVIGLKNYGFTDLAQKIMTRWCYTMENYYAKHKVILEKYDVCQIEKTPHQGEYEVQEGFGWSNGVYLAFSEALGKQT